MFTTEDFFTYGRIAGFTTIGLALLATLGFVLKWGFRFRLVGATGFLAVLTGGLFSLSLVPIQHVQIPGAVRYALVYDTGSTQTVITVPPQITPTQLEATLQQAASDLFSPGRLGRGQDQLTVRARTVLHPEPGVSQPLVLGQVQRSLSLRDDPNLKITLYSENIAKLPQTGQGS
uniref:DUF2518 family protein n=1 Tax=Cyanothece sp. (strain PCC 7425 / ATCC 29141) TaxID=395961 RepID=B8HK34_CYAP4